jgi:hypothetical protein
VGSKCFGSSNHAFWQWLAKEGRLFYWKEKRVLRLAEVFVTLLDIFHATPQSPQRLIPIDLDNQCVASVAALRETKMSSSVSFCFLIDD